MISSTGCNSDIACQESVTEDIHANHADFDRSRKAKNTGKFHFCLFLFIHSIYECLCAACTVKSDVSPATLSNLRIVIM